MLSCRHVLHRLCRRKDSAKVDACTWRVAADSTMIAYRYDQICVSEIDIVDLRLEVSFLGENQRVLPHTQCGNQRIVEMMVSLPALSAGNSVLVVVVDVERHSQDYFVIDAD